MESNYHFYRWLLNMPRGLPGLLLKGLRCLCLCMISECGTQLRLPHIQTRQQQCQPWVGDWAWFCGYQGGAARFSRRVVWNWARAEQRAPFSRRARGTGGGALLGEIKQNKKAYAILGKLNPPGASFRQAWSSLRSFVGVVVIRLWRKFVPECDYQTRANAGERRCKLPVGCQKKKGLDTRTGTSM